jgi:hypothetical protein
MPSHFTISQDQPTDIYKGPWWCRKSTKHHRNPIVLLHQRQLNYRNLTIFIYQFKFLIPSHIHLATAKGPQKVRKSPSAVTTFLPPPPVYNPIFLDILPSLSHPSVATRPRRSVKTAQYNAAAHFCQQPILYHPRAMSQHVCSRIGSIARWLLQYIRCYRWGCLEYGNGAREF